MIVRLLTEADAEAVSAVHQSVFPSSEWGAGFWAKAATDPGSVVFVVEDGSGITGIMAARCVLDEAEILTVGVAAHHRRAGLGRALLAALMDALRARKTATVFLEVSDTNRPAQDLYAQAGFVEVGRRAKYYGDGSDALIMECRLARV